MVVLPPVQPKFQIFTLGSHYNLFFQPYFSKNCLHNNNVVLFLFFTYFSNVYVYIMTSSQRNIIKELSCTTDWKAVEMVKETSSGLRVKLIINSGLHIFSHKNPIKVTVDLQR